MKQRILKIRVPMCNSVTFPRVVLIRKLVQKEDTALFTGSKRPVPMDLGLSNTGTVGSKPARGVHPFCADPSS